MTAIIDPKDIASAVTARRSAWREVLGRPTAVIALAWLVVIALVGVLAPVLPLRNPLDQNLANAGALPTGANLLGTDELGRDVFSRLLHAGASAIGGVLLCVAVATVLGVVLGLLAGYFGGRIDAVASLGAEVLFTLPGIIVMLLAVAIFGPSLQVGMITLGLLLSAGFYRLVRASVRITRAELYVDAARVSGIGNASIIFWHILPNVLRPIIVQATLTATLALLLQAGLSFLGQGPPPPSPQWGAMVREAADNIYQFPWLMIPSGITIILTALAFNAIGDAFVDSTSVRRTTSVRRSARLDVAAPAPVGTASQALTVTDLRVSTTAGSELVHGVSFVLTAGKTLGLVGESGSGKTLTALAGMGLLPDGVQITGGSVLLDGDRVDTMSSAQFARMRGPRIALISQEPMVALDPSSRVEALLVEPLRRHRPLSRSAAKTEALALLEKVGIKRAASVIKSYPHQLSGGMAQRVAIAIALTGNPRVLVADEPTTALDVTVQAEILDLLRTLQRDLGMALLLVTHDFGVVADICDEIVVMQTGEIVEANVAIEVFDRPVHPYTKELLAASPELWKRSRPAITDDAGVATLLSVDDVRVEFGPKKNRFTALNGVSLDLREGETVGVVGESGSGKTTLGRAILGLTPIAAGRVTFAGEDITHATSVRRRELSSQVQVVFQNPYSSLDPRMTISQILMEPLLAHGLSDRAAATARIDGLLDRVGLPANTRDRRPVEFSGGQRQRIAIARALAMGPRVIVCDEALSALDLSTQERIVTLLQEIQADTGVSYLFIAHDLSVVKSISDRVVVMYHGDIVESGDPEVIGEHPTDPYTKRLLLAAPLPHPVRQAERRALRIAELAQPEQA